MSGIVDNGVIKCLECEDLKCLSDYALICFIIKTLHQ